LFCLRQALSGGLSRAISFQTAHNCLLADYRDLLPRFYQPFPFDRQKEHFPGEHPIFSAPMFEYDGRLRARLAPYQVKNAFAMRGEPVDALTAAATAALDEVFQKRLPAKHNLDAVEPKLFGIGAESCTVGSHEFYLGYAITRRKLLCLDAGHFHPTESIADKISSVLLYVPEILLHVSRGVRWDSDHVVTFTDELQAIAREVVADSVGWGERPREQRQRVHLGLDYFDASINRLAAWVIGTRNLLRALLLALLEPPAIRAAELAGDNTARLALQEEVRSLPFGAVWDYYCENKGVPVGEAWLAEVKAYEESVLSKRR